MARFFFNVRDDVLMTDPEGSVLDGPEAALAEAHEIARELLVEGLRRSRDRRHWSVEVEDEARELIGTVFLARAAGLDLNTVP
jgi:hypothetical protein